jgi:DNA polymerase-3 subunit epsilon
MHKLASHKTSLSDLKILALDCQATGANPARGHLLEIGWTSTSMDSSEDTIKSGAQSRLIRLPDGADIPRAVQRITGITHKTQQDAVSSEFAWRLLLTAAGSGEIDRADPRCPIVIHFARFETPFLKDLHRRCGPSGSFPLQIVCTHEIARRLLPELPRRGIRAVAGYYGHCLPEYKRSAGHAIATALIWQHMVRLLESECGIYSLQQLINWLAETKPAERFNRVFPMNPDLRRHLPNKPGIYLMSHKGGRILYIGKAKSLKSRVNSYFRPKAHLAEHILEMLAQARGLEVTPTETALEAAIRESDEIKRHSPPYNIALRRRQRHIAFCTKDLTGNATKPDANYTVGPLPAGKTVETLATLGRCLRNGFASIGNRDPSAGCTLLALPPEYAPETGRLQAGFEIFRAHHREQLSRQMPLRFLTALGARQWREKLAAQALKHSDTAEQNETEEADQQLETDGDRPAWTADAVANAIAGVIRHNAYLIRRARWFCLLSESTLVWSPGANLGHHSNWVIFANGAVKEQGGANETDAPPLPPGYTMSYRARQKNFDLATYDRMRVVTTEMRRILSEGRQMKLYLRPNVVLGRQELSRALQWV